MTVEHRRYNVPRGEAAGGWLREVLAGSPGLPAQALALLGLLYLAATEGGYYATDWYPVGLGVLTLLALWAGLVPPAGPRSRAAVAAVLLFALFAAWALLTISWADERSAAWDGGNRAVLYAALFALFSLWSVRAREARWLIAIVGFGIAVLGLVELVRFAAASDPSTYVLDNRLSEPVGYQNGNVALWLMGSFCCVWLAVAREAAPVVRGLALGAVAMLVSLALLGESRGSLFALPIALLIFLAATPGRLRLLAAVLVAAAGVVVAAGPVLDVVDADEAGLADAVDSAAHAILISSVVVAMIGALGALAERAWRPSPDTRTRLTRAGAGAVAVAVLIGLAFAGAQAGEIRSQLSERWAEFKSNDETASGSARLGSGGTNRYGFWTVAWDNFERAPLRGVGMDNFQQDYLERGDTREKPRFAHSVELALLSETGLIGIFLFLGAIAAALVAALAHRGATPLAALGASGAALGAFSYWLLHSSVDWLYELPALGGLGLALLGLACGVREHAPEQSVRAPRVARVAGPILVAVAAASFALPWLAERQVVRASESWREAPAAAYERLHRAADLNPTAVRAYLFEATIAVERGEHDHAEQAFLDAVEREPRNSYAWLQLAALASARQDQALARRRIARASALSPTDVATRTARRALRRGARITPEQVLQEVLKYSRRGVD